MKNHGNKDKNDIDNGYIHDHKVRYKQKGVMGEKTLFLYLSFTWKKKDVWKERIWM